MPALVIIIARNHLRQLTGVATISPPAPTAPSPPHLRLRQAISLSPSLTPLFCRALTFCSRRHIVDRCAAETHHISAWRTSLPFPPYVSCMFGRVSALLHLSSRCDMQHSRTRNLSPPPTPSYPRVISKRCDIDCRPVYVAYVRGWKRRRKRQKIAISYACVFCAITPRACRRAASLPAIYQYRNALSQGTPSRVLVVRRSCTRASASHYAGFAGTHYGAAHLPHTAFTSHYIAMRLLADSGAWRRDAT